MAEDSDLERTEQATSKRLEQAREKGDVPRSREMTTAALMLVGGSVLWTLGGSLAERIKQLIVVAFSFDSNEAFNIKVIFERLSQPMADVAIMLLPIIFSMLAVAVLSPILIGGWVYAMEALMPNLGKLNPLSGVKRMFSVNSLMELVKAVLKTILISSICWLVVKHELDQLLGLGNESLKSSIPHLLWIIWVCFISLIGGMVFIALIDVPYQKWSYAKKLRMSRQEIKQESKDSEGDPHVKGRIRALQRAMAQRRMMSAVPTADVVVTNPTHYAVALKYTENRMKAPKVIAKGTDMIALRIRELAKENNIPIMEAPPLARALHQHTELDDEIPQALYTAVAEVLAYVFQLRMYNTQGGKPPDKPKDLSVPDEMDPLNSASKEVKRRETTTSL